MTIVISMLRGVNLGPHNRVKMEELRALYKSLELENPRTYVQSGNVLFKTREPDLTKLSVRIKAAIEKRFGINTEVILRTAEEMRTLAAENPFAGRKGIEPSKLLVSFLANEPGIEASKRLRELDTAPEELVINGREIFVYYPNGMARPKFQWTKADKILNIPGTGRNWNSVTKMLQIAEEMEGE
ncbi:MAG TPA: DUF1697 domain-containing protein [Terriglobales bacterium]|nr:DUF1697 domain-containing protein [Terriglobales bacterium]